MRPAHIVIPCYNEARRLDAAQVFALTHDPRVQICLVDDGSTDATPDLLRALAAQSPALVDVIRLPVNSGKAEAVRTGLNAAVERGADIVGYLDADLAIPTGEMLRLLDVLTTNGAAVVLASRVQLLGSRIQRRRLRHYVGRLFAKAASHSIAMPVYDTQCGAKWFRVNPTLRAALAAPFRTHWMFDVELLGRLSHGFGGAPGLPEQAFMEVPLRVCFDVAGSKVRARDLGRAAVDLARIAIELRR